MEWFWKYKPNGIAVLSTPDVGRTFLRCKACGRVVMHYWVCKAVGETGRTGCPCGGIHVGPVRIAEWRAAWYVLSRLVWRKWILHKPYWDPRMPERRVTLDA